MQTRILYLFTRTPLHVGAGSSIGAVDQPVQRERHTQFPIIPGSSLKGSLATQWPTDLVDKDGRKIRLTTKKKSEADSDDRREVDTASEAAWLFGSDTTDLSFGGSLSLSEARLLAFPIRSARGGHAWITCPLMLKRAARDGALHGAAADLARILTEPKGSETNEGALFKGDILGLGEGHRRIVLEDYAFDADPTDFPQVIADAIAGAVPDDPILATLAERLVVLSDGMLTHFTATACEVAQHVRISDETGTADPGGLFNQENVPSEALFYTQVEASPSRVPNGHLKGKTAADALTSLEGKLKGLRSFQFGGDASTGLGFCTLHLAQAN